MIDPVKRLTVAVIAAVILALLVWAAVAAWRDASASRAKARLSTNQSQAVSDSAKDAIGATGAVSARQQASDDLTRRNADDIRNAKGADAPVDPAVRDAGLASLCRRPGYAGNPKCVRFAAPAGVARAGSAGPASGR